VGVTGAWFSEFWERFTHDYVEQFDIKGVSRFAQHFINSILIVIGAWVLLRLIQFFFFGLEKRVENFRGSAYRRRVETISSLFFSSIKYAVYIVCLLWILTEWGVNTESLVVGTAVLGAGIGFGAQGLVQDIITGLSILAENQLSVGDYVEISGKAGAVEEVGLRVIKIRDALGAQHVIFNRTINMVSNFTAGALHALVDVSLENEALGEKAKAVAAKVCRDLAAELPYFTSMPQVDGVHRSSTSDVFLRLKLSLLPNQESMIQSVFVERLKSAFAANEIKIPNDRVRVIIMSDLFKSAMQGIERTPAASALASAQL
jgi:small conductance mechanosensitive channel